MGEDVACKESSKNYDILTQCLSISLTALSNVFVHGPMVRTRQVLFTDVGTIAVSYSDKLSAVFESI